MDERLTPNYFKTRSGLELMHINVRSLMLKIDMIKAWVHTTDLDVLVLSETWLNKSDINQSTHGWL